MLLSQTSFNPNSNLNQNWERQYIQSETTHPTHPHTTGNSSLLNIDQTIDILDYSSKALENFKLRVPSFPRNNIINKDFFSLNGKFDLIIEQTFFCADFRLAKVSETTGPLSFSAIFLSFWQNL